MERSFIDTIIALLVLAAPRSWFPVYVGIGSPVANCPPRT